MKIYTVSLFISLVLLLVASASSGEAPNFKIDDRPVAAAELPAVVSYADVLDEATPSVVAVYTSRIVSIIERPRPQTLREYFEHYYSPQRSRPDPRVPTREESMPVGVGSGVIVTESGYVVTNNHVIRLQNGEIADEIRVRLKDDREYVAELIGTDEKTDVAVLKIEDESPFPAITIADSDQLRVGDVVFAIGNPRDVGLTATQGIVSAIGRQLNGRILGPGSYENFIQTDAAINTGNSGGALIDARGRLIGINTAIVSDTGGSIGLGFAIPTKIVQNVMTNLIETGEVPRGLLGLFPEDLSWEMAEAFGLETTRGALVNQVQPGSPAEKGGIRHGDIIVRVDGVEITSAPQLRLVVSQTPPGTEVEIGLIREGETLALKVVLGSLSGKVVSQQPTSTGGDPEVSIIDGVELRALDARLREQHSVPDEVQGVLVARVDFESDYANLLPEGMVILEVNGEPVREPKEIKALLKKGSNRLYAWAGGNMGFVLLRMK